jgi:single-strand DNA-binding protein
MGNINKVILVGHLGADPVIRNTNTTGRTVANLSLYTNERWNDRATGQRRETKEVHRIVCWAVDAENAGKYLRKGSQIYVEGKLQTRKYEVPAKDLNGNQVNYANGQPVMTYGYITEVVARNIQYLDKRPSTNAYGANAQGYVAQAVGAAGAVPNPTGNVPPTPDFVTDVDVYDDLPPGV